MAGPETARTRTKNKILVTKNTRLFIFTSFYFYWGSAPWPASPSRDYAIELFLTIICSPNFLKDETPGHSKKLTTID
jgi:hypothetical protein